MNSPNQFSKPTDPLDKLGKPYSTVDLFSRDATLYPNHLSYPVSGNQLLVSRYGWPLDTPAEWSSSKKGSISSAMIRSEGSIYTHYHENWVNISPANVAVLSAIAQTDPRTVLAVDIGRESSDGKNPNFCAGMVSLYIDPSDQTPKDVLTAVHRLPDAISKGVITPDQAAVIQAYDYLATKFGSILAAALVVGSIGKDKDVEVEDFDYYRQVFNQDSALQKIHEFALDDDTVNRVVLTRMLLGKITPDSIYADNDLLDIEIDRLVAEGVAPYSADDLLVAAKEFVEGFYTNAQKQDSLDKYR